LRERGAPARFVPQALAIAPPPRKRSAQQRVTVIVDGSAALSVANTISSRRSNAPMRHGGA